MYKLVVVCMPYMLCLCATFVHGLLDVCMC